MEMVNGWTGRDACALQEALRMSHQAFAAQLKVGLRIVVADWHEKPRMRPRPETQQLPDAALAQASEAERERFAALAGHPAQADTAGAGGNEPAADGDNGLGPRSGIHRQVLADAIASTGPDHHYAELARQLLTTAEDQAAENQPHNTRRPRPNGE